MILLCFILLYVACGYYEYVPEYLANDNLEIAEYDSQSNEEVEYSFYNNKVNTEDECQGSVDLQRFLRYIWIPVDREEWRDQPYNIGFRLDSIEDNRIVGALSPGDRGSGFPPVIDLRVFNRENNLFLEINGDTAKGYFTDSRSELMGYVELHFKEEYIIHAVHDYVEDLGLIFQGGELLLHPWNIKRRIEAGFNINDELTFEIELNSWGNVVFIAGYRYDGRREWVDVFLTAPNGNILYSFASSTKLFAQIREIIVEDLDGDGLLDVIIISGREDRIAKAHFYQLENGWFRFVRKEE